MKTKVLILILPSFFKFSIFPSVTDHTYGHFSSKFSQKLLYLGLWNLWQFCLFSESVTTSDGYRRGYVSFAHFLLYLGPRITNSPSIMLYPVPFFWRRYELTWGRYELTIGQVQVDQKWVRVDLGTSWLETYWSLFIVKIKLLSYNNALNTLMKCITA